MERLFNLRLVSALFRESDYSDFNIPEDLSLKGDELNINWISSKMDKINLQKDVKSIGNDLRKAVTEYHILNGKKTL